MWNKCDWRYSLNRYRQEDCQYGHDEVLCISSWLHKGPWSLMLKICPWTFLTSWTRNSWGYNRVCKFRSWQLDHGQILSLSDHDPYLRQWSMAAYLSLPGWYGWSHNYILIVLFGPFKFCKRTGGIWIYLPQILRPIGTIWLTLNARKNYLFIRFKVSLVSCLALLNSISFLNSNSM